MADGERRMPHIAEEVAEGWLVGKGGECGGDWREAERRGRRHEGRHERRHEKPRQHKAKDPKGRDKKRGKRIRNKRTKMRIAKTAVADEHTHTSLDSYHDTLTDSADGRDRPSGTAHPRSNLP